MFVCLGFFWVFFFFLLAQKCFFTANIFGCFYSLNLISISSPKKLHCTFVCVTFTSHIEWWSACARTPTTTALLTTAGTFHNFITWFAQCKLAHAKILQNSWFSLVVNFIINKNCWCPWCNGYHHRKWTWQHVFKSWMRLIAFQIGLIPLGKVWIQLFSLQLWVNSRADWVLQLWCGN